MGKKITMLALLTFHFGLGVYGPNFILNYIPKLSICIPSPDSDIAANVDPSLNFLTFLIFFVLLLIN